MRMVLVLWSIKDLRDDSQTPSPSTDKSLVAELEHIPRYILVIKYET